MRILYLYNEVLPKKTAHDVYVFHNCASLAEAGCTVDIACGWGTSADAQLQQHYQIAPSLITSGNLQVQRLPIVRRNILGNLSWNAVFFWAAQRLIRRTAPDVVIASVLKQAAYHFFRKVRPALQEAPVRPVRYVYEVHGLCWYPNQGTEVLREKKACAAIAFERAVLAQADLLTVTTAALRQILREEPYALQNPIEIVPLAVHASPLPLPREKSPLLKLMYIGQLYPAQGVGLLVQALAQTEGIAATIVGGKPSEIAALQEECARLGVKDRVLFRGFCAPSELPAVAAEADAFVASFEAVQQMPYVAHTKLLEYAAWGRPILVPDLEVCREHFPTGRGVLFFEAGNVAALARALQSLKDETLRARLQGEVSAYAACFSWAHRARRYCQMLAALGIP